MQSTAEAAEHLRKKANGNGMKSESSILNIQIPITCKFTTQPI